jgi:hypothetical protein
MCFHPSIFADVSVFFDWASDDGIGSRFFPPNDSMAGTF